MNEKIKIVSVVILLAAVFIFGGCAARPVVIATDRYLIEAQRNAGVITRINAELAGILQLHDSFINREIDGAIGGIELALRELGLYDEFVLSLIGRIRELERIISEGTGTP